MYSCKPAISVLPKKSHGNMRKNVEFRKKKKKISLKQSIKISNFKISLLCKKFL